MRTVVLAPSSRTSELCNERNERYERNTLSQHATTAIIRPRRQPSIPLLLITPPGVYSSLKILKYSHAIHTPTVGLNS